MDRVIPDIGDDMRGYNLYSYCFNNPVNMCDSEGDWPKWIRKVGEKLKNLVKKVKKTQKQIKKKFSNYVGTAVNVGKEKTTGTPYYFVVGSIENGTGYNKSFSTGKTVNVYMSIPENSYEIWEYGSGIDINVNGYGGSVQVGRENAVAVHMKNSSFELGTNILGRVFGKYTYSAGDGYAYSKLSIHIPELLLIAAVAAYSAEVAAMGGLTATKSIF